MNLVFIGLGANVGDTRSNIRQAIQELDAILDEMQVAPIYVSKPMGYAGQADFLNTVVKGRTEDSPPALLTKTQAIEKRIGKIKRFHWGPREIDIDILFHSQPWHDENLIIPHPGIPERDFVLRPLCDLAPDFVHPRLNKSMRTLLKELPAEKRFILRKLD